MPGDQGYVLTWTGIIHTSTSLRVLPPPRGWTGLITRTTTPPGALPEAQRGPEPGPSARAGRSSLPTRPRGRQPPGDTPAVRQIRSATGAAPAAEPARARATRALSFGAEGRKVDIDDLVSAPENVERLRLYDRNLPHSWLRSQSTFPRPIAKLAIGNVWQWSAVERWAAETGRGRWELLPQGLNPDLLVPLRAWAAQHEVQATDLIEIAGEGLLPLAKRGGRFYLDPKSAEAVWAEHGDRMLAKYLVVPRYRRRSRARA